MDRTTLEDAVWKVLGKTDTTSCDDRVERKRGRRRTLMAAQSAECSVHSVDRVGDFGFAVKCHTKGGTTHFGCMRAACWQCLYGRAGLVGDFVWENLGEREEREICMGEVE
jgi:hypothetical protein